jgi:flagellar hook-basal body complex protein FliE
MIMPITPVGAFPATATSPVPSMGGASFSQILANGVDALNTKLQNADAAVHAFVLDDSIPVHQVTFALQQAQSSMELALQVRTRLLEGYQQIMNMQL